MERGTVDSAVKIMELVNESNAILGLETFGRDEVSEVSLRPFCFVNNEPAKRKG